MPPTPRARPTPKAQARPAPAGAAAHLARARGVWSRHAATIIVLAMSLVCVATGAHLAAVGRMRDKPAWWTPAATPGAEIVSADQLENALAGALHARRDLTEEDRGGRTFLVSEPWSFAVRGEVASAWLSEKLPAWLVAQGVVDNWPGEVGELRVAFRERGIYAGMRLIDAGDDRYLWASLAPRIRDDGSLWLHAQRVHVGRMSVPASWLLSESRTDALLPADLDEPGRAGALLRSLAGEQPVLDEPRVRLGDGRRVRLLDVRTLPDGRLIVTCQTEFEPKES
ncbi:MAG: hypothetical protein AAFP26_06065 [Planctomycetota bacterium]